MSFPASLSAAWARSTAALKKLLLWSGRGSNTHSVGSFGCFRLAARSISVERTSEFIGIWRAWPFFVRRTVMSPVNASMLAHRRSSGSR